jgi:hypothetical protein
MSPLKSTVAVAEKSASGAWAEPAHVQASMNVTVQSFVEAESSRAFMVISHSGSA